MDTAVETASAAVETAEAAVETVEAAVETAQEDPPAADAPETEQE